MKNENTRKERKIPITSCKHIDIGTCFAIIFITYSLFKIVMGNLFYTQVPINIRALKQKSISSITFPNRKILPNMWTGINLNFYKKNTEF